MEHTWLIQRLTKPFKSADIKADFPVPTSLKEAATASKKIVSCDYMGAAEFEWGAIPDTFKHMWENRGAYTPFREVLTFQGPTGTQERVYWGLCRQDQTEDVKALIAKVARGEVRLKEEAYLKEALNPVHDFHARVCGWLELDNHFFFTIDKPMQKGFLRLFGKDIRD
jgi:hypothetical protein